MYSQHKCPIFGTGYNFLACYNLLPNLCFYDKVRISLY